MPLQNLNHINVMAKDLQATRDFYVEVLGLRDGERPPFKLSAPLFWTRCCNTPGARTTPRSLSFVATTTGPNRNSWPNMA